MNNRRKEMKEAAKALIKEMFNITDEYFLSHGDEEISWFISGAEWADANPNIVHQFMAAELGEEFKRLLIRCKQAEEKNECYEETLENIATTKGCHNCYGCAPCGGGVAYLAEEAKEALELNKESK